MALTKWCEGGETMQKAEERRESQAAELLPQPAVERWQAEWTQNQLKGR